MTIVVLVVVVLVSIVEVLIPAVVSRVLRISSLLLLYAAQLVTVYKMPATWSHIKPVWLYGLS